MGFDKHSAKPLSPFGLPQAVKARTGGAAPPSQSRTFIWRTSELPSSCGIMMSVITTSGRHVFTTSAASARSEERRVGKSVDLGGRRITEKKNNMNKQVSLQVEAFIA